MLIKLTITQLLMGLFEKNYYFIPLKGPGSNPSKSVFSMTGNCVAVKNNVQIVATAQTCI